jgi:hypothetical protein
MKQFHNEPILQPQSTKQPATPPINAKREGLHEVSWKKAAAGGLILAKLLGPGAASAFPYNDPAAIGSDVTMSAYSRIHHGMSLRQVQKLLGAKGSEGSRSDVIGETFTA